MQCRDSRDGFVPVQGQLAPDVARLIIDSIKSLADVRATEELEARIAALEEARDARA